MGFCVSVGRWGGGEGRGEGRKHALGLEGGRGVGGASRLGGLREEEEGRGGPCTHGRGLW